MLNVFIAVHPFQVFTTKQPHRCSYFHTHSNNLQQKQFFCVCLLKVFFRNTFHQLDNQYVVKQQYILSWVSHSLVSEMKDLFALVRFCFKMKIILIYHFHCISETNSPHYTTENACHMTMFHAGTTISIVYAIFGCVVYFKWRDRNLFGFVKNV